MTCLVILFVCFLIPSEGFLNGKYNDSKAFLFSSVRDARSSCGGVWIVCPLKLRCQGSCKCFWGFCLVLGSLCGPVLSPSGLCFNPSQNTIVYYFVCQLNIAWWDRNEHAGLVRNSMFSSQVVPRNTCSCFPRFPASMDMDWCKHRQDAGDPFTLARSNWGVAHASRGHAL